MVTVKVGRQFGSHCWHVLPVDCDLLGILLSLWANNQKEQAEHGGHRRGFMGYVVLIAASILVLEGDPSDPVTLFCSDEASAATREAWNALVASDLRRLVELTGKPLVCRGDETKLILPPSPTRGSVLHVSHGANRVL